MSRGLALAMALAAVLGGAGCADKRIDLRNVERIIADRFAAEATPGAIVDRVVCPELVPTREGEIFECTVVLQGGEERVVMVEQLGGTRFRWYPRRDGDATR